MKNLTFNVATYNIRHGSQNGMFIDDIAKLIVSHQIDIIGFQEVDRGCRRSGLKDVLTEIAKRTSLPYFRFFKAIDYDGGEYGLGILSRFIIQDDEVVFLSHCQEQRIVSKVQIDIDGIQLSFFNTHLELGSYELVRKHQFKTIREIVAQATSFVLTGDFNVSDWNQSKFFEYEPELGHYPMANTKQTRLLTFQNQNGWLPLDNIICSNNMKICHAYVCEEAYSDHYMLVSRIQMDTKCEKK